MAFAGVRPIDGALAWSTGVCRDWLTNVNEDMKALVVDRRLADDNVYWPHKQLVRFVRDGEP